MGQDEATPLKPAAQKAQDRVAIEQGSYDKFKADLLVCRSGGAIFRSLEPSLEVEELVARPACLVRSRARRPRSQVWRGCVSVETSRCDKADDHGRDVELVRDHTHVGA